MSAIKTKAKGTWFHRALIYHLSFLLALLFYWLLGFVMKDIGAWPGPIYSDLEEQRLDHAQVSQLASLEKQIADAKRRIAVDQKRQEVLRDSTGNSERTMNQLLELQRLQLQKEVTPAPEEQQALAQSQQLFLSNQQKYQVINEQIAQSNEQLNQLEDQARQVRDALQEARQPVREEFQTLVKKHNFKIAAIKLTLLVPLLVGAVLLSLKKRSSLYAPMIYACGVAVVSKVFMVMHEHFPKRYFKYILIFAALALVVWVLAYLLRMIAFPKADWLLKQYREAYESFLCPICGYPIRRGPLRYLAWTRRSLRHMRQPPESTDAPEEPYVCPNCSTQLFEECPQCHGVRHSLLPACSKCGSQKQLTAAPASPKN